jgi:hypothetical protein
MSLLMVFGCSLAFKDPNRVERLPVDDAVALIFFNAPQHLD